MRSLRFHRTVTIAPGLRLNPNKRSVGVSTGIRCAPASINGDGRSTRAIGFPGAGLYWSQRGASAARVARQSRVESNRRLGSILALLGAFAIVLVLVAIVVALAGR